MIKNIILLILLLSSLSTNAFAESIREIIKNKSVQKVSTIGSKGTFYKRSLFLNNFLFNKKCIRKKIGTIEGIKEIKIGDRIELNGEIINVGDIQLKTYNKYSESNKIGTNAGCLVSYSGYQMKECNMIWVLFDKCTVIEN